jgi:HSP20 family molecular chaperone IbpA
MKSPHADAQPDNASADPGLKIVFEDSGDLDDEDIIISDIINWQPLFDLYVMGDFIIVTIELAGIQARDISIFAGNNYMMIDGTRRTPRILQKNAQVFHNLEIPYGRFSRRIDFPLPVLARRLEYTLDSGILVLRFPVIKEKVIPIEG